MESIRIENLFKAKDIAYDGGAHDGSLVDKVDGIDFIDIGRRCLDVLAREQAGQPGKNGQHGEEAD